MHNIQAVRYKSGEWEVFVADSALESMYKVNKKLTEENIKLETEIANIDHTSGGNIHKVLYDSDGSIVGYSNQIIGSDNVSVGWLSTPIKKYKQLPHQKYEVGKTYCIDGNCFTVGYRVIGDSITGSQNVAIEQKP